MGEGLGGDLRTSGTASLLLCVCVCFCLDDDNNLYEM